MGHLTVQPVLIQRIREVQSANSTLIALKRDAEQRVSSEFRISVGGLLRFQDRVCVPDDSELKRNIMTEAHISKFVMHPEALKCTKICDSDFGGTG